MNTGKEMRKGTREETGNRGKNGDKRNECMRETREKERAAKEQE